jgi:hypothetical protein
MYTSTSILAFLFLPNRIDCAMCVGRRVAIESKERVAFLLGVTSMGLEFGLA